MRHRGTAPAFLHVHVYALSSSPAPQRAYSPSLSFAQHFALSESRSLTLSLLNSLVSLLPHSPTLLLSYSPTLLLSIACPLHQNKEDEHGGESGLSFFCILHPDFGEDVR
jgi:hypothetical protein